MHEPCIFYVYIMHGLCIFHVNIMHGSCIFHVCINAWSMHIPGTVYALTISVTCTFHAKYMHCEALVVSIVTAWSGSVQSIYNVTVYKLLATSFHFYPPFFSALVCEISLTCRMTSLGTFAVNCKASCRLWACINITYTSSPKHADYCETCRHKFVQDELTKDSCTNPFIDSWACRTRSQPLWMIPNGDQVPHQTCCRSLGHLLSRLQINIRDKDAKVVNQLLFLKVEQEYVNCGIKEAYTCN